MLNTVHSTRMYILNLRICPRMRDVLKTLLLIKLYCNIQFLKNSWGVQYVSLRVYSMIVRHVRLEDFCKDCMCTRLDPILRSLLRKHFEKICIKFGIIDPIYFLLIMPIFKLTHLGKIHKLCKIILGKCMNITMLMILSCLESLLTSIEVYTADPLHTTSARKQ